MKDKSYVHSYVYSYVLVMFFKVNWITLVYKIYVWAYDLLIVLQV